MSEYQYYEFVAVDGPISDEGLRYAQSCSTRATVSRTRWQNEYSYGDFRGSVQKLLKHYDAHFYIANWGTVRLGLAFSKGTIDKTAIQHYLRLNDECDTLGLEEIGDRTVVWWQRHEEGGCDWAEGEGIISELIGLRQELMQGDYRGLFLGWLADIENDEFSESADEQAALPPIPPGLDRLTGAQAALIEHFPVDADAITAAVMLSKNKTSERVPLSSVLERLPVSEMRALLVRVAEGGGAAVMAELNRLPSPQPKRPADQGLTCEDFSAKILEARELRLRQEADATTYKRQREEERRKQNLAAIMARADTIWSGLDAHMSQQIASAYDRVAAQLRELRDAYAQTGNSGNFQQRLEEFRSNYSNRPAMMRRLKGL